MFSAITNAPGYLPDGDDNFPVFPTAREAWEWLADERKEAEDDAAEASPDRIPEGYSATVNILEQLSEGNFDPAHGVDDAGCGSVTGPTPGYEGNHDQGRAYNVEQV